MTVGHRLDENRTRRILPFQDWMLRGACSGKNNEIFFPVSGNSHPNQAKAICAVCTHRIECLDYALEYDIDDGIWGGLTRNERRRVRPFRLDQDPDYPARSAYG